MVVEYLTHKFENALKQERECETRQWGTERKIN